MNFKSRLLAVVLCGVAATMCLAQGGGGGRQGGGMRGMRGNNFNLTGLLSREDVQADLQVTEDQKTKIAEMRTAMRGNRGNRGAGGAAAGGVSGGAAGTPPAPRTRPTPEQRAAQAAEREKQLATVLTPAQITRLHEIQIQLQGDQAITNSDVQEKLGLSSDQKAKITDLNSKFREAMTSVFQKMRDGSLDRTSAMDTMTKNTATLKDELHKVLTPAQADKLKALGGKPFTSTVSAGG